MKRSGFMNRTLHHFQRGISLIELMIAMLIGSILILGITEIFINNQRSYLFQQSQVGNQENGRFTLAVLEQELSKAGYRSLPSRVFPASTNLVAGCIFPEGVSVVAISASSFCIQYQVSNRADTTCQGTRLTAAEKNTIVRPYNQVNKIIVEKIAFDPAKNAITCATDTATEQLVTGVADVRFDYGFGQNKTVTAFSATPTQAVGAVRYAALMQSGSVTIRDTTALAPKALSDWNSRFARNIAGNGRIYQIVQGTIMLRNQMP